MKTVGTAIENCGMNTRTPGAKIGKKMMTRLSYVRRQKTATEAYIRVGYHIILYMCTMYGSAYTSFGSPPTAT